MVLQFMGHFREQESGRAVYTHCTARPRGALGAAFSVWGPVSGGSLSRPRINGRVRVRVRALSAVV